MTEESSSKRTSLYESRGETSVFVDALITEDGALQISGQDVGKAPSEFWGDSDYEYWLTVPADAKDNVLLALVEHVFAGDPKCFSAFRTFVEERGIPCSFDSWR